MPSKSKLISYSSVQELKRMEPLSQLFTKGDYERFPFLRESGEQIRRIDFQLEDFGKDEFGARILRLAEERVRGSTVGKPIVKEYGSLSILVFSASLLVTIASDSSYIKKRFALYEARRATAQLINEPADRLLRFSQDFGWKAKSCKEPTEFSVHFSSYLRNAPRIDDSKWKLSNSVIVGGWVYLNKKDFVRLLEEEIKRRIESLASVKPSEVTRFSPPLVEIAGRLKPLVPKMEQVGGGFPATVVPSAFPPCLIALYTEASKSHHLSHIGRFTLVSFLCNIGMGAEEINNLFKGFSDYKESLTRYQIEHIAGGKGGKEKYVPPACKTLQTHQLCQGKDKLCEHVGHPLRYYKRKAGKK